ncbi:50S ribosomal protein L3 [Candidatus Uhrbacteria bacterium]|nr:50S ribosomal protein L3 [Candidatus Uhrbacteria bacterium]
MKYILGKKLNMTQVHTDSGMVVPVTVVKAGPCVVSQVKTTDRDGYNAIQFCFGEKKKAHKPQKQQCAGLPGITKNHGAALVREVRVSAPLEHAKRGSVVSVKSFVPGDHISVTGVSKGRGFAGVVKRHHFHGHPTTHGHKDQERMPGSIGSGGVQHVFRGQRMAGRLGGEQVTVHNLEIIAVDEENGLLHVKGALPGSRNGFVALFSKEGEVAFEEGPAELTHEQTHEQTPEEISEKPITPNP